MSGEVAQHGGAHSRHFSTETIGRLSAIAHAQLLKGSQSMILPELTTSLPALKAIKLAKTLCIVGMYMIALSGACRDLIE